METIAQRLIAVDAKLRRWETRLKRATNMVTKLAKQRRRLADQLRTIKPGSPPQFPVKTDKETPLPELDAMFDPANKGIETDHVPEDDLPAFLDRSNPLIAEAMTAARKKAEEAERHKMPLTGKAAIDYIKKPRHKG